MSQGLASAFVEAPSAPPPRLKLDTTREFGTISPPENLLCVGGRFMPTAYAEERPAQWRQFNDAIREDEPVEYKTRVFEQDGFSFDADGNSIEECMDKAAAARARKMHAQKAAERAAREAHRQAMREAGFEDEDSFLGFETPKYREPLTASDVASNPNDGRVREGAIKIENTFDIIGWAQGRVQAPWFTVNKAFREQHAFVPKDKAEAVGFLREHGLLTIA